MAFSALISKVTTTLITVVCLVLWEAMKTVAFTLLSTGPLLGYPLQGISTSILSVTTEPGTSPAMISACVSRCMLKVKHRCLQFSPITWLQDCLKVNNAARLHTGPEAGRRTGPGASHVIRRYCWRGVSWLCTGWLGPKTWHHQRYPESSWQQGAASNCALGWDDGELYLSTSSRSQLS